MGNYPQVEVTMERNGTFQKVKLDLDWEVVLKLELNKLADADKQERLESFLTKEVEN